MNGAAFLGDRRGPAAHRAPGEDRLLRPHVRRARRGPGAWSNEARARKQPLSVGLVGNVAEVLPELVRRGVVPDVLTDQTSAHDLRVGYVPRGHSLGEAARAPRERPGRLRGGRARLDGGARRGDAGPQGGGAVVFDYGNNLRGQVADHRGLAARLHHPRVRARVHPAAVLPGAGPFRWVALSGDPRDIATTDEAMLELFPKKDTLARWLELAREKVPFQGLPARICWLEYGERAEAGAQVQLAGQAAQGRRRPSSSAATTSTPARSPRRTARPRRCTTAPTPSPTGRCSTPWSTPPAARAGSRSTTAAASASATRSTPAWWSWPTAARAPTAGCERVLTADPGMGVMRHADAGYDDALRPPASATSISRWPAPRARRSRPGQGASGGRSGRERKSAHPWYRLPRPHPHPLPQTGEGEQSTRRQPLTFLLSPTPRRRRDER